MEDNIRLLYVDLFCGAGGTTTGVEMATLHGKKCAKVIACVNHDPVAIASHLANHPEAHHFTEDIRTLDMEPLKDITTRAREKYPNAKVVLWASLECTNFSKAKGGIPRDADSRTLANHLFRYIEALEPDYIQIENVEEFMSWGELDEKGKPIDRMNGADYVKWTSKVMSYGYSYSYRLLNSADFGAYTSRKRFFGQFSKFGNSIKFPEPTYSKDGCDSNNLFSHGLSKWKPVKDVLDLDDEGKSIFGRKKQLCERTLERIYAGLIKFVAGGKDAFLVKYNSMNRKGKYIAPGIDEPAGTVTTVDHHAFITAYYGNGHNHSLEEPSPVVTTVDRFGLVTSRFLDMQYGNGTPSSIDSPSPTVVNNPKQRLVTCKPLIMSTNFGNVGSSIEKPSPTVTANHKWQYLMNPQFASKGGDIDKPCFTLIARMDKMPPYLISNEHGIGIAIYDDDSSVTRRIKEFMAMYDIVDINMRMLKVSELKAIMGFPRDYVLKGTQAEQKKFIGNAVEVNMSRCLCEALAE